MPQKALQQMNNKHSKTLKESLMEDDLKWLVSDEVLIDMHKTKMGKDKDYLVLSIAVNDRTPAEDLAQFLENSVYKFEDVEVSPATDSKGRYLIYIEFARSPQAYEIIEGLLKDTAKLSGVTDWKFKSLEMPAYIPVDRESLEQHLIVDPIEYDRLHPEKQEEEKDEQEQPQTEESVVTESIKARLKFLLSY